MSKTGILATAIFFYALAIYLIGLYGYNIATDTSADMLTFAGYNLYFITGIASLGWLNAILFTPLLIIVGWVILTSFMPTANAGS